MFNDKYGLTETVLEGKKTQTRRIIKGHTYVNPFAILCQGKLRVNEIHKMEEISRYAVGEILAVAQSYEDLNKEYISNFNCELVENGVIKSTGTPINIDDPVSDSPINYWGDEPTKMCSSCKKQEDCFEKYFRWIGVPSFENKMFVKAEFMLHQIRITGIRIQRLQDISDEDCLKEGIKKSWWMDSSGKYLYGFGENEDKWESPREAYAALIDRISGKGTWEKNPWVFVYDFEIVK